VTVASGDEPRAATRRAALGLRLAWRNLWRNPRRTLLTLSAVAFATTILVFMVALQRGGYGAMIESAVSVFTGHLQVQARGYHDDPRLEGSLGDATALEERVSAVPGVEAVASRAEAYALAFSIPVDTPGLIFLCRDSAATPGAEVFDRPLSTRFDEQDAFVIFDDVEIPRERLFLSGHIDVYNSVTTTGLRDNMTNQTTIRALTKLEFAYGLATRMAEAIGDASPATNEMLGELLDYGEVARSAVLLSAEHGRHVGDGVWFPDGRSLAPMRSLLATWFPRVNEILMLIGSHNLLATPSRRELDDGALRPLIDEFLHGAKGVGAEERAALFRLAWDFVGSTLAGRNVLYERFYLTSAARNRINNHLRNVDRSHAHALVDGILAAGRAARRHGSD